MRKALLRNIHLSNLFWRLFAATLGAALLIIVISMGSSALQYEGRILQQSELRHDVVARRMAREMGLFFEQAAFQLQLTANIIKTIRPPENDLQAALNEVSLSAPHFMEISFVDMDGKELATSAPRPPGFDYSGSQALALARGNRPWISGVLLTENRVPFVIMSSPMIKLGKPVGLIFGKLSLKKLWWWIDQISSESGTYLTVTNSDDGLVIADEEKELIGKTHPYWTADMESGTYVTSDGSKYISFHKVPNVRLTIVTQSKLTTFTHQLYDSRFESLLVGIGLVILSMIVAALFSIRTSGPVRRMIYVMEEYVETGRKAPVDSFDVDYRKIAGAFNDIAERLEEKQHTLVQQESLVAVGHVSSILAHELRHGMHMILNLVYFLKADDENKSMLRKTIFEMTAKIDDLMEFARGGTVHLESIDSDQLLSSAVESVSHKVVSVKAEIRMDEDREKFKFSGDSSKLVSAVSNLIRNSLESGATSVKISACIVENRAEFTVVDDGPGIPEEVREKVFEPFYTTKRKGFGIGLALVHSVSRAHGGRVYIAKSGDEGSDIRFEIPLVELPDKIEKSEDTLRVEKFLESVNG